jgi:hypothetical protein
MNDESETNLVSNILNQSENFSKNDKLEKTKTKKPNDEHIKVFLRIRPNNPNPTFLSNFIFLKNLF